VGVGRWLDDVASAFMGGSGRATRAMPTSESPDMAPEFSRLLSCGRVVALEEAVSFGSGDAEEATVLAVGRQ